MLFLKSHCVLSQNRKTCKKMMPCFSPKKKQPKKNRRICGSVVIVRVFFQMLTKNKKINQPLWMDLFGGYSAPAMYTQKKSKGKKKEWDIQKVYMAGNLTLDGDVQCMGKIEV